MNLAESVPEEVVVIRPAEVTPVQETGTAWLIGAPRVAVGCPGSLLHSRMAPGELASNPVPVTVTCDPPFRQVPGFAVRLGPEPVDVVDFALHGTVVVVDVLDVVVVDVLDVVVVDVLDVVVVPPPPPVVVVVVVPPPPPPAKPIVAGVAAVPSEVPNWITHESPALTWAAVGGQGYRAASAAASLPALSVPVAGGPTVPVATVKLVERVPVAVVVFSVRKGFVQETGTAFPATEMVGWPGALLHSRTAPVALVRVPRGGDGHGLAVGQPRVRCDTQSGRRRRWTRKGQDTDHSRSKNHGCRHGEPPISAETSHFVPPGTKPEP